MLNIQSVRITDGEYTFAEGIPLTPSYSYADCVYPKARQILLNAADIIEKLADNWDAQGSVRTSALALEATKNFIKSIPLTKRHPDSVGPDGDGDTMVIWNEPDGDRLVISIEPAKLHLSQKCRGKYTSEPDIVYDGSHIPQKILAHIPNRT